MDDDLTILNQTILAHARELAGKEWLDIHKPSLIEFLTHAGLTEDLETAMLSVTFGEVPVKAILRAMQQQFMDARTTVLAREIANEVVNQAKKSAFDA